MEEVELRSHLRPVSALAKERVLVACLYTKQQRERENATASGSSTEKRIKRFEGIALGLLQHRELVCDGAQADFVEPNCNV